jgi:inosine-uridine nucleoside N-ribohydrolase
VPNIARALEREPRIAGKCRFVGMHGSFRVGYGGSNEISAEANVRSDPAALRTVLAAPWKDILLTPLDTCGLIDIEGKDYHAIWCATPDAMLRALIENYCIFAPRVGWMHCDYFALRSTVLFDCVAVYLAYAEDLVGIETLTFNVTDDGFTRVDPRGPFKARIATTWKGQAAFEEDLADRLLQRGRHARR